MFKGTTPTHTFTLDQDTNIIKELKISYYQNDELVLVKRTADCTISGNTIVTKLSQEDTFKFIGNANVMIIIRVLTHSGDALMTEPMYSAVRKCLDDEVLV